MTALGLKTELDGDLIVERELTEQDILALGAEALAQGPTSIARLRHRHHLVARLLVEGRPNIEVAAITGYAQGSISQMKADPAFQELMEYYKGQTDAVYVGVHERLARVGEMALDEIEDRLHTKPDTFSNKELRELTAETFERTVAPGKGLGANQGSSGHSITIQFVDPKPQGQLLDLHVEKAP